MRARARPVFSWLPVAGLIPAFLLASWSLTQPWAEGRAFIFVGISRRPAALLLVLLTLLAMVGASVAVATRGRRHDLAAAVHFATSLLMGIVSVAAFRLIADAPTKLLGIVPVATLHPSKGLRAFAVAAGLVALLGLVELLLWRRHRRRLADASVRAAATS